MTFSKERIIKVLLSRGVESNVSLERLLTNLPDTGNLASDVPPYLRYTTVLPGDIMQILEGQGDENGSDVLYQDLAGDWELTSDANDSTPNGLNLTEVGGSLSYGAEGVSLNGTDQYLSHADDPLLEIGNEDFMVMAEIIPTTLALKTILGKGNPEEYELAIQGDGSAFMTVNDDLQNYASAYTPGSSVATDVRSILFASFAVATNTITIWYGNGSPATEVTNGGLVSNNGLFTIGCTTDGGSPSRLFAGTIRHVRLWKGDVSVPIAAIPWLYNSNTGRTYAELGDYSP